MKVLRYGISDDEFGELPAEQRSWHLAARGLEELTGQPWETVIKRSWPGSAWSEEVERDIAEERPDMVALLCVAFWVSYPSAPLKVHRSRLPGTHQLARFGFWAASKPLLGDRWFFHAARRLVNREATAAFFFEPEVALARVEQVIRVVLRHEDIALAVRGPLPLSIAGSGHFRAICEARRAALDQGLAELCRSLHVEYIGFDAAAAHPKDELLGDRIHVNARGHTRRAGQEFDVMARAWKSHHPGSGN
ncbi:MAG: SGNH/GDSL hydrolase family protein [Dehalococcoidia bacterium]|nr:SGNH/GDSL hydrolase family protein [Dehalococcoidia bacterium]